MTDSAGLKRAVLVGWSYAGRVISDYVTTHGASKLAGINFVDASIKADPALAGDNLKNLPLVRAGLGGRPLDATGVMSKLKLPVLVTHGAQDRNSKVGNAQYTASVIPGAKLSIYEGIGHSPFYEDAARFNAELAAFVRQANKTK
jgi:pimeloyl-ACP methyl ester carboxylesterase